MSGDDERPDFINLHEVSELSLYSVSSIFRKVADGSFPRPIKLGAKKAVWIKQDVQAWLAERIRASRRVSNSAG